MSRSTDSMKGRARAWRGAASIAVVGFVLAGGVATGEPVAATQEPGVIAGQLVNGTADGPIPDGAEVVLHVFSGETHEADSMARTDQQGGFRFDALRVGEEITYQLTAAYVGVAYSVEPIRLTAAASSREIELTVYEATPTDPGLRATNVTLVLGSLDADRQELTAMELVSIANRSDRTFAPSPSGPAGPMGLLRFGLAPGAKDLRPGLGLDPAQLIQVDRGFASTAPVKPGDNEFGYTYRFPYSGERYVLEKSLPYGAERLQVLTPEGGPDLASADLSPQEPVQFGTMRLRVWAGRDFAPGTRLALALQGLPPRPVWRAVLEDLAQPVVMPTAVALALLLGVAWTLRARRSSAATHGEAPPGLLEALADLDEAFAAGQLADHDYRARRSALKETLRATLVKEGALPRVLPGFEAPKEARAGSSSTAVP